MTRIAWSDYAHNAVLFVLVATSLYLNFSLVDVVKQIKSAKSIASRGLYDHVKFRPEDSYCESHIQLSHFHT